MVDLISSWARLRLKTWCKMTSRLLTQHLTHHRTCVYTRALIHRLLIHTSDAGFRRLDAAVPALGTSRDQAADAQPHLRQRANREAQVRAAARGHRGRAVLVSGRRAPGRHEVHHFHLRPVLRRYSFPASAFSIDRDFQQPSAIHSSRRAIVLTALALRRTHRAALRARMRSIYPPKVCQTAVTTCQRACLASHGA